MKIAYIGYDLSCTKSTRYFQQQGYEVTYFLKEKKQNFNFKPFSAIDLFIDHVMIPGRSDQRTARQKQLFKKVTNEFTELKVSLNPFQSVPLEISPDWPAAPVYDLTLLKDIQHDGKQKKLFFEVEKKGVESFDFLFIEAHPFVAEVLTEKKIKAFRKNLETEYSWTSLRFEIGYVKPIDPFYDEKMFFVVQDPRRKSLVDNWFFCHFQENVLEVWGFIPYLQVANPGFKKFYTERVRSFISEKFKFIYLKEFIRSDNCTVGALDQSVPMVLPQTQSAPNFTYWSTAQVTSFWETHFTKKLKTFKLVAEGVARD